MVGGALPDQAYLFVYMSFFLSLSAGSHSPFLLDKLPNFQTRIFCVISVSNSFFLNHMNFFAFSLLFRIHFGNFSHIWTHLHLPVMERGGKTPHT